MNVLDYVIIRGQQAFEDGREINPIEIKVEDNRIRNLFDKYKNNKVKFKFIRQRNLLHRENISTDNRSQVSKVSNFKQRV